MQLRTLAIGLILMSAWAADAPKPQVLDSGSFGIMVNGRRVAAETFKMEQSTTLTISSELKMADQSTKAVQTAQMEIAQDGSLKHYVWKEMSPGKAQLTLEPDSNTFLILRVDGGQGSTPKDTTHPLSPTTPVIDDNFFSHLQVAMWRYLASICHPSPKGGSECTYSEQKMPILNPHQQQSMVGSFSYLGVQRMRYKGTDNEYRAFKFQTENGDWLLWMDDQNHLIRVLISAEATEVLRD